jgi:hypothetical protein
VGNWDRQAAAAHILKSGPTSALDDLTPGLIIVTVIMAVVALVALYMILRQQWQSVELEARLTRRARFTLRLMRQPDRQQRDGQPTSAAAEVRPSDGAAKPGQTPARRGHVPEQRVDRLRRGGGG